MKYYLMKNNDNQDLRKFGDWWELIAFLDYRCIKCFVHNPNDSYGGSYVSKRIGLKEYEHVYHDYDVYTVFDGLMRIINKVELQDGLKKFNPSYGRQVRGRKQKYFNWMRSKRGYRYANPKRRGKRFRIEMDEARKMFPNKGRLNTLEVVTSWGDDWGTIAISRSWKDQSKKRKQWLSS